MAWKRCSPGQIIGYSKEAEIFLVKGGAVGQVWHKIGTSKQTYYVGGKITLV